MNKQLQLQMLREAGHVRRCHTLVTVGDHYNIAYHSWNATMLLLMLHPDPSMALVKAIMFHDVGERYAGDVPAPVKWDAPEFKRVYNELESAIMFVMLGEQYQLTADEAKWLAAVDALEFFLYCNDQLNLGNEHIHKAYWNIYKVIKKITIPEISNFFNTYEWHRTNDRLADVIS